MKKFLLSFFALGFTFIAYAQPVSDNATIPMAVTLNSILRLNVTTGGNIEFSINTLADYTNGIAISEGTTTRFNIASSVDFEVLVFSEGDLVGTDLTGGSSGADMAIGNINYNIIYEGAGLANTDYSFIGTIDGADAALRQGLVDASGATADKLAIYDAPAGDITQNAFAIGWDCGVAGTGTSLLDQALAADRYSTNVFLVLQVDTP